MWGCSTAPLQFDFPSSEGTSLRSAHHKQRTKKWSVAKPGCTERLGAWDGPNRSSVYYPVLLLYTISPAKNIRRQGFVTAHTLAIPPVLSNSSLHSDTALPLLLFQLIQQLNLLLLHHIHQGSCSLEVSFCLRDILQQKKSPSHKSSQCLKYRRFWWSVSEDGICFR